MNICGKNRNPGNEKKTVCLEAFSGQVGNPEAIIKESYTLAPGESKELGGYGADRSGESGVATRRDVQKCRNRRNVSGSRSAGVQDLFEKA